MRESQSGPYFPSPWGFWFRVPDNAPLVYTGSFETASAAAREWFPALQPMSTALLRPWNYSSHVRLSPEDLPLGLATAAEKSLKSPSWYRRSFGRATGVGDWLTNPQHTGTRRGPVSDNPFVQGLAEAGVQVVVVPLVTTVYVLYFPLGSFCGELQKAHILPQNGSLAWTGCPRPCKRLSSKRH